MPGLAGEQVCVDGKAVRGSRDGTTPAVHLVSAFADRACWVLTQQAVAEKSNEITAIPDLLALLDLTGAVVSSDAMGCQKAIAQTIIIEIRRYALSDRIGWLDAKPDWAGLQAGGRVESTRPIGNQTSTECRYFLCSFLDRDRFSAAVRGHWAIENAEHWVLDVQFGEDACRTRRDHSAENLAVIRRMVLNVLRHNGPPRDSIRRRKLRAALSDEYRLHLLLGTPTPATP